MTNNGVQNTTQNIKEKGTLHKTRDELRYFYKFTVHCHRYSVIYLLLI